MIGISISTWTQSVVASESALPVGPAWSPSLLDGLVLDVAPYHGAAMFQDSAGTTPAMPDDPVGLVVDKSGAGSDLTQSIAASRPIYKADGSLCWIEMDGIDDYLSGGPVHGSERTITVAFRNLNTSSTAFLYGGRAANARRSGIRLVSTNDTAAMAFGFQVNAVDVPYQVDDITVLTVRHGAAGMCITRFQGDTSYAALTGVGTPGISSVLGAFNDKESISDHANVRIYGLIEQDVYATDAEVEATQLYLAQKTGLASAGPDNPTTPAPTEDPVSPEEPEEPTEPVAPEPPSGSASRFTASALKVLDIAANKRTVSDDFAGVTIMRYTGDSRINGQSDGGAGAVHSADVPDGQSGPTTLNANRWIVGAGVDDILTAGQPQTFAPGNSKMWRYEGRQFEFKHGKNGASSIVVRWSTDDGLTWKQSDVFQFPLDTGAWINIDFGAAASRIVELIGCDQTLLLYGFNFDTGDVPQTGFSDPALPAITVFGDSYVFGQGAGYDGNGKGFYPNDQQALKGMTRKIGEYVGSLQIRNHGLRGNQFSEPTNVNGSESSFQNRLICPPNDALSEADYFGPQDVFIIPSTINDDPFNMDEGRRASVAAAFAKLRQRQPTCLILFPVGARAPQFGERDEWLDDYKNGFKDTFGATEAEWLSNGAWLLDGSRRDGANWTPEGAEGSSPHFGVGAPLGDPGHPTAAGHDYLAQKYAEGLLAFAQAIVDAS